MKSLLVNDVRASVAAMKTNKGLSYPTKFKQRRWVSDSTGDKTSNQALMRVGPPAATNLNMASKCSQQLINVDGSLMEGVFV